MNPILVPLRNGLALTRAAHKTFLAQDVEGGVDLLYVDNNSTDGTSQFLAATGARVVTNRVGKSVSASWNQGLSWFFGRGESHVLVVNNDVALRPDTYRWLLHNGGPFVTAIGDDHLECVKEFNHPLPLSGAEDATRVGTFIKMGIPLTGVVHVGLNDGYEIQFYEKMGLRVMGFEPLPREAEICRRKHPNAVIHQTPLGSEPKQARLHVPESGTGGASLLRPLEPLAYTLDVQLWRLNEFPLEGYDCLVVDTQGTELDVLKGAGDKLQQFKCLVVEGSAVPHLYEGELPASEIVEFLKERGFVQHTPICEHDDILFVRDDVHATYQIPNPAKIRSHPDFSCFLMRREVWERVGPFNESYAGGYVEDADYHLRMHRAGIEAISIQIPFYHIACGTQKNANAAEAADIAAKADANRARFMQQHGVAVGSAEYYALFGHEAPEPADLVRRLSQ